MLLLMLIWTTAVTLASTPAKKTYTVTTDPGTWRGVTSGASPTDPGIQLMKREPNIQLREWSPLQLPGAAGRTSFMMSIAGQSAPDLYYCWYHIIRNDISQGFIHPLNDWIGHDKDGDGQVSPEEATWKRWGDVSPLIRQVATVDGNIYGLPTVNTYYMGIIFRMDLVRQAGMDPDNPPQTWDEFLYWCQKLTDPGKQVPGAKIQQGQRAFLLPTNGFMWLPWINTLDGTPVVQHRTSPTTGKTYTFPMEATEFIAPDTGENLSNVEPQWRAAFASEEAVKATAFLHRLRWQRWIRDPKTQEPINLTNDEAKNGKITLPDGRVVKFDPHEDVITGVVRTALPGEDTVALLARGEVAATVAYFNDIDKFQTWGGLNPNLVGGMAFPAPPGGKPVIQLGRHFTVMSEGVARRPRDERDVVWKVMEALTSPQAYDEEVRKMVLAGRARFVNPNDLRRLGFGDYVKEVPTCLSDVYAGIDNGAIRTRTEPFAGYWVTMDEALNKEMLSILFSANGENFDYVTALNNIEDTANNGTMFARSEEELQKYRPMAWTIFGLASALVLFFVVMIVRTNLRAQVKNTAARAGVYKAWLPWLLLFPAVGLIGLWGYYPLLRGITMAFQDYRIVGESSWVGLDNFISIFLNPDFYISIRKTFKYVFWSLLLVFTTPIGLSLLLSEIPKGKVFWRSIFFLPQLTSGVVIVLLWKLMYNPTEMGLVNQILSFLHITDQAYDWLGDARFAMVATIIPTVWASMGMSSLIYLAALKGIPDELYEAADLDGGGMWAKLRYITLPQLMPLIIINFVGAFIATFQTMGNIFLLTFGGPGKETMVLSMAIWIEAYNNLRFGVANAMAWILGSALIGFAYLQINILRKVEFRRVEEV
jgi:multiple sugar transport system permease protein